MGCICRAIIENKNIKCEQLEIYGYFLKRFIYRLDFRKVYNVTKSLIRSTYIKKPLILMKNHIKFLTNRYVPLKECAASATNDAEFITLFNA